MKLLLNSSVIFLLTIFAVHAQSLDKMRPVVHNIMLKYDYNLDSRISEKEFMVLSGDGSYRAHLSNLYHSLDIKNKDHMNLARYWAIELSNPRKYRRDLSNYFNLLDHDKNGIISTADYANTYQNEYGYQFAALIDENHDNLITYKEYTEFDFTALDHRNKAIFRTFDINEDGIITLDEVQKYFQEDM